ncbi:MAG: carboxypeptidase regulatory-like domain-containing protein, partial [Nitrososphaerota archaeon]
WELPEEGVLLMGNGSSYYILHYPSGFKEPAPIAGLTAIIGGKTPEGRILVLSEKTLVDLITGKSWTIPVKGKVVLMDDAQWLKRYGQVPYIAVKEVDYRGNTMGVYVVSLWRFPGVVYELENPDAKNWRYLSFSDNGMWAFNGTHIFAVVGKEEDPQVGPRIRLDSRFSFTSTIGFNNTTPITLHLPPTGEPPYLTEYLLKSINASIVYLETIPYTVDLAAPPVKEGNLYLMAVDPGGPFWMTPKVCLPGTSQCGEPGEFPEPPRLEPADEGVMIVGKGVIKYTYLPIQVPIGFGSGYLIYGPGLGGEYRPITLGEMDNIRIYGSFSPDFSYIHKSQQNVGFNFNTLFIIIPSAIGFTVARSAVIKKMIEDMRHVGTRVYELDPTKLDLVTDTYKGWLEWIYEAGDIGFKGRRITLVENLLPESAISEARPRVIGSTFTIKATVETPEKARNALERVKEVQEILQKTKVEIEKWWPTLLDNDPQIRALADRARDLKEAMEGVALSFKEGLITFDEATDSAMQILKEFKDDIIPALEKRVKELADIQKQSFFDKVRSALSKIEGAEVATSIADLMIDVSIDRAIGTAAAGAGVSAATAGVGAAGLTFLAINGVVAVLRWLEPFGLRLHGTEYGYVVAYELEVGGTKRILLYGHTSDKAFGNYKTKDIVREAVEDILLQDVQGDLEPHQMVIDKIEELPKLYTEPEVEAAAKEGKFDVLAQAIESRFQVQANDVKGSVERLYYELDGEKLAKMLNAKPEEIKINRILLYSVYIPWSVTSWFINIEVPINVRERCSGFSILYTVGRHEVITDPNRQAEILNPSQITWIDDEGNARTETATWVPGKRGAELKFSFLDEAGKKGGIGFTITSKSKIPFAAKVKLDANLWVKSHLIPMNGTYSFQMEIPCDLGITMSFSKVELVDLPWKPGEIAFKVYAYDPDVGAFGDEYRFIKIPGDAFTWDWKESGWYGLADARRLPLVSLLTSCYKLGGEILDGAGAVNTRVSVDFDSMSNPRYAKVCVYTTRPDAYAKLKAESWVEVYTQETNKTVIHGRAEERYEVAAGDWGETAAIGGREYYAKCFMMDIRALSAEARQIACQAGRPDVHLAAAVWLVESNYPGPEHDDHATASTLITCREGEADFCVLVLDAISKQPVQGARLSLANQTGHQWPEADTGSDGRYYYGKLPLGVYSLTAVKSGYEGFQGRISLDRDYPCSSPYAIELNRIETKVPINLDVLVVDGATNAPISGAAVSIYQDGALAASGQTGGDGIASFTLNSSIRYRIAVEKEGYAAQEKEFVSKKNATEIISLSSAPQLYNVTVKVLDGNTSTPIKGIKVSFRDGGVEFTEYTSDDGIARFKLPKEVYTLEVIDETGKYTSETRTVAVYQDMEITVILWPAAPAERQGYIILKVLDAVTKGPIAGASVAMKNRETGQILSGSTNSSGMVSFYAEEGWYYYNVTKEGYMSIRNAMRFFAVNIVYTEYLTPGAVSPAYLKVRVLDAETLSPIEGAYVTVENSTKSLTGVTAATGWANFTVAEGFYEITAFKQGYYASAVSAYVSGTFHVYLTLKAIEPQEKNFTVNVYVLNAVGATPIRGALVRLYSSNYNFTGSTDENGLAALENVPVGSYLLRVEKDGFVPFNTAVTISNNATIYVSMIPENIRPMHKLSVRVIDADNGSALEGVLVKLKNGTMWFQAYTNSTGWAELILPEDNYWLTLSKSGYHTHMESIWIVNDMSIERMLSPLTASAYGDVVIKAVDLMTRAPIPGVAVAVTNESRPMFVQYTNSSGMAAFKLASGIYKIDLAHEEYAPKHVEAFLLPGRTYEFELVRRENITAMLRLEVVDAETGLPVAGARILLQNSTKRIIAVTGDDGGASMLVEKGLYEISVSHPKYYDFGPITYYVGGDQLLKLSLTPRYMCPPPPGSNWTEPVPCGGLYWLVVQVVYRDGVGFPGAAVKVYDALNQTEVAE